MDSERRTFEIEGNHVRNYYFQIMYEQEWRLSCSENIKITELGGLYTNNFGTMYSSLDEAMFYSYYRAIKQAAINYSYSCNSFLRSFTPTKIGNRFGIIEKAFHMNCANGMPWTTGGRNNTQKKVHITWLDNMKKQHYDIHSITVLHFAPLFQGWMHFGRLVKFKEHLCEKCKNVITINGNDADCKLMDDGRMICGVCCDYLEDYSDWNRNDHSLEAPLDMYSEFLKKRGKTKYNKRLEDCQLFLIKRAKEIESERKLNEDPAVH